MPICTTCTHFIPYLYTIYESKYNLRLEQCPSCHNFCDPYVEHDSLNIFLDLILLKRGVFRHLLYNRGSKPRRLVGGATNVSAETTKTISETSLFFSDGREKRRWMLTFRLAAALVPLDAFIRWSYLKSAKPVDLLQNLEESLESFLRALSGCLAETIAFHTGIMSACYIVLNLVNWFQFRRNTTTSKRISDIRKEFRLSLIPLSLFYSSLIKLFLLLLLTIWIPSSNSSGHRFENWGRIFGNSSTPLFLANVLDVLDDDKLDREWLIRNVLGGMSAGFGLRVVLDIHPIFSTIIILCGWATKTYISSLISHWVGGDVRTREAWLAYSIP